MQARVARWTGIAPAGAVGLAAFVAYVTFAAPGMYWFDSQELGSAAVRLGVPHPTGFPLFLLVGHVFAWFLPFGELAFRVHLGSALAGAVCVGMVARLVGTLAGGDLSAKMAGAGAAVALGASLTFFRQATVTEVYAITAATMVVGLAAAIRVGDGGRGLELAFFAGICAVGVHASFRLLLGIPLFVIVLWRLVRGERWPILALGLVVLGAGAMAVPLPLRSASRHVDELDWGHPRTAGALVDHLDAARIRRAFGAQMLATEGAGEHARLVATRTDSELGTLALVAAFGGVLALAARRERRGALVLLLVVAAGDVLYAVFLNPMGIEDRQTGVPLALCVAVLAGCGLAAGARAFRRAAPFAAAALALIAAVEPILEGDAAKLAGRASEAPRLWAEAAMAQAPPGTVVLTKTDSASAGLFWLTLVEPVRPDMAGIARQHVWDGARSAAVLGVPSAPTEVRALVKQVLAERRPIFWEKADDAAPVPLLQGIPVGWIGVGGLPLAAQVAQAERAFAVPALDDQGGAETAARAFMDLGALLSRTGDFVRAAVLTERAVAYGKDAAARVNLARYLLAMNDVARAREQAERALRALPRRADAWSLLGVVDARERRCREARQHFSRALALDPSDHDATTNLARMGLCRER